MAHQSGLMRFDTAGFVTAVSGGDSNNGAGADASNGYLNGSKGAHFVPGGGGPGGDGQASSSPTAVIGGGDEHGGPVVVGSAADEGVDGGANGGQKGLPMRVPG